MHRMIYTLILWYLRYRLGEAERKWNGPSVDRLVNAIDMIEEEINAAL